MLPRIFKALAPTEMTEPDIVACFPAAIVCPAMSKPPFGPGAYCAAWPPMDRGAGVPRVTGLGPAAVGRVYVLLPTATLLAPTETICPATVAWLPCAIDWPPISKPPSGAFCTAWPPMARGWVVPKYTGAVAIGRATAGASARKFGPGCFPGCGGPLFTAAG